MNSDPYWTLDPAAEVFAVLRTSELADSAKPIEDVRDEYLSITRQIAELEKKRHLAKETGKEAIHLYNAAYCQLFLQKVREKGRVYCDCGNHVVSEVSIHLVWNHNCAGHYILHICSDCLLKIRAGEISGDGSRYDLYEMKEEEGNRLRLKGGEWRLLPEHLHDYTRADECFYIDPDLGKEYGLPTQFGTGGFD